MFLWFVVIHVYPPLGAPLQRQDLYQLCPRRVGADPRRAAPKDHLLARRPEPQTAPAMARSRPQARTCAGRSGLTVGGRGLPRDSELDGMLEKIRSRRPSPGRRRTAPAAATVTEDE